MRLSSYSSVRYKRQAKGVRRVPVRAAFYHLLLFMSQRVIPHLVSSLAGCSAYYLSLLTHTFPVTFHVRQNYLSLFAYHGITHISRREVFAVQVIFLSCHVVKDVTSHTGQVISHFLRRTSSMPLCTTYCILL